MRKRIIIAIVATVLAVAALFGFHALTLRTPPFKVSVTFVGYTNDPLLAVMLGTNAEASPLGGAFVITNLSHWPVRRSPYSEIYAGGRSQAGLWSEKHVWYLSFDSLLRPGESETVTVPPPTNRTRWGVGFAFYNEGTQARLRKSVLMKGEKLGLTKYKQANYWVTSDEIRP